MTPAQEPGRRWRRWRPRYGLARGPLPALALVNTGLLVALFMTLGSEMVQRPGLVVQLPVAAFVSGLPYGHLVVTVTGEGQVFFNDEVVPLERLGAALVAAARERRDASLTIEADGRVSYGTIVRIVNLASVAGLQQVNLAVRPSGGGEALP